MPVPPTDPPEPHRGDRPGVPLRFLMVCLPYSGHVNPTLGTAHALVAAGHQVTYVLDPRWAERVGATGARFIPYDRYPASPGPLARTVLAPRRAFETAQRLGPDHDCIVYEGLFTYGKALADGLGLPAARLSSTFAYNRAILDELASTGGMHVTGLPRLGLLYRLLCRHVRRKGFIQTEDFVSEIVDNLPALTVVYTSRAFQPDQASFPQDRFLFSGPSLAGRAGGPEAGDPALAAALASDRPLVYISLGTVLNRSERFYQECVSAFADRPVQVVMSIGDRVDPKRIGPFPPHFLVRREVPQLDVLRRTDVFVTHGGMNSVNEAILFEVPMVAVPMGNDQPTVARRLADLGLGRRLDSAALRGEVLARECDAVMGDPGIRERLAEAGSQMRACGGNDAAVRALVELATTVRTP